jgi:hypothetical protein
MNQVHHWRAFAAAGRSKDADEAMRRLADLARPKLGP